LRKNATVFSALFLVSTMLMLAPRARAQAAAGSISALNGNVAIERAGTSIPGIYGTTLQVGDKLTTDAKSRVTIALSDGSQIELTESSTLVLTENTLNPDGSRASTKVTLLGGLVRSFVRVAAGAAPNFEVYTPNAVAAARGTKFDVSYEKGQARPVGP
jgi:hypothetical protein